MLTYQDILAGAQRLSTAEKARLLAEISAELRAELSEASQSKQSLLGIWKDEALSSTDIDTARQELWKKFPP
jgi:hypothetical protein